MFRRWWIYLIVLIPIVAIVFALIPADSGKVAQPLQQFIEDARAGRVQSVKLDDSTVTFKLKGQEETFETRMEEGDTVREVLQDAGIPAEEFPPIKIEEPSGLGSALGIILAFFPLIFIVATLFFFFRLATRTRRSRNVDPVCGIKVDQKRAAGSSSFQDVTYYFCSQEHKQAFDGDPVRYLLRG